MRKIVEPVLKQTCGKHRGMHKILRELRGGSGGGHIGGNREDFLEEVGEQVI